MVTFYDEPIELIFWNATGRDASLVLKIVSVLPIRSAKSLNRVCVVCQDQHQEAGGCFQCTYKNCGRAECMSCLYYRRLACAPEEEFLYNWLLVCAPEEAGLYYRRLACAPEDAFLYYRLLVCAPEEACLYHRLLVCAPEEACLYYMLLVHPPQQAH